MVTVIKKDQEGWEGTSCLDVLEGSTVSLSLVSKDHHPFKRYLHDVADLK